MHVGPTAEEFLRKIKDWNSTLMETEVEGEDGRKKHPLSEDLAMCLGRLW
jgi:hypothetical protein